MNKGKREDTGWRATIRTGSEDFPDHDYVDEDDDIWIVVERMCHVYSTRIY